MQARGGWRQRAQIDLGRAPPEEQVQVSFLATGHLLQWADGHLSAKALKLHLLDAVRDGCEHVMVSRLSQIGGPNPGTGNAARALLSMVEELPLAKIIDEVQAGDVTHLVRPSKLLDILRTYYPRSFRQRLGADEQTLTDFWQAFRSTPEGLDRTARHPHLNAITADGWRRVIPISVHEDAGPFTKSLSCITVSFSSVVSTGSDKETQFLIASVIKQKGADQRMHAFWDVLLADFCSLATDGLAGWKFVLLAAKGDLETRSNSWGMASYNAAHEMCSECQANRSNKPFTDLSPGAAWRQTLARNNDDFMARMTHRHPLFTSPFADRNLAVLDLMHIADCNGVANLVGGSILRDLVERDTRLGATQQARLAALNSQLKRFYEERPGYHRIPPLRLQNLTKEGWAVLNGSTIKAANCRSLSPFLVRICEMLFDDSSNPYHLCVSRVATSLNRFYQIVYGAGVVMKPEEQQEVRRVLVRFGVNYQKAREFSRVQGKLMWNITPKVHMFLHFSDMCLWINPRWVQNYAEESQVGSTTTVWARSARGRYRRVVQRVVLLKRLMGLCIRFERGPA